MKTKLILFSFIAILLAACTVEDNCPNNSQLSGSEKAKLYQLADKYGVKFNISDNQEDIKTSIKELETFIKISAAIQNAKFELIPNGKNKVSSQQKLVMTRDKKEEHSYIYAEKGGWSGGSYDEYGYISVDVTWETWVDSKGSTIDQKYDISLDFSFSNPAMSTNIKSKHTSWNGDHINFSFIVDILLNSKYSTTIVVDGFVNTETNEGTVS